MLDRLLSSIAPHSCCGCGLVGEILCPTCKNDIVSEPFSRCLVCLKPILSGNLCQACVRTSPLDAAWCVAPRQGTIKALLDTYKFSSARDASRVCSDLLLDTLPLLPAPTIVVVVPTASSHQRSRGFDHTALIARRIARARGLPYRSSLRRVDNQTQHFKSRADRLKVTIKSFEVHGDVPEVILLVDDIYTTGSTLLSCARVLKKHGAKQVFGAVIARQVLDEGNDL